MTNEKHQREFIELVVEYPNPDLCTYPEYRGKPYFSIKYRENGKYIVGYGSYKIEMISQWIKEYFMPSVQPKTVECEDCISREYILSKAHCCCDDLADDEPCCVDVDDIKEAPSVQPKAKWIPVSERLPETAFGCLVTVEEDDRNGEPQSVLYPDFVGYDGETWNDADGEPIPFEVIAWMPLPEPYKAESEDKE